MLPRDLEVGRNVERSFIGGTPEAPGIKALLERRAPMGEVEDAYERTPTGHSSVGLLKTAVSPGTRAYTAFSIIAREDMEAIVVLAALLAGLRGAEQTGSVPLPPKIGSRCVDPGGAHPYRRHQQGVPQLLSGRLEREDPLAQQGRPGCR